MREAVSVIKEGKMASYDFTLRVTELNIKTNSDVRKGLLVSRERNLASHYFFYFRSD